MIYLAHCTYQCNCPVHERDTDLGFVRVFTSLDKLLDYTAENINKVLINGVHESETLKSDTDLSFHHYRVQYLEADHNSHLFGGFEVMHHPESTYHSSGRYVAKSLASPSGSGIYWEYVGGFEPPESREGDPQPLGVLFSPPGELGGHGCQPGFELRQEVEGLEELTPDNAKRGLVVEGGSGEMWVVTECTDPHNVVLERAGGRMLYCMEPGCQKDCMEQPLMFVSDKQDYTEESLDWTTINFDPENPPEIYTLEEFRDATSSGSIGPDDGCGSWATATHEALESIASPLVLPPKHATHVVWYGK